MRNKYVLFIGYGPEPMFEIGPVLPGLDGPTIDKMMANPDNALTFKSMGHALNWYIENYTGVFIDTPTVISKWIITLEEAHAIVTEYKDNGRTHRQDPIHIDPARVANPAIHV